MKKYIFLSLIFFNSYSMQQDQIDADKEFSNAINSAYNCLVMLETNQYQVLDFLNNMESDKFSIKNYVSNVIVSRDNKTIKESGNKLLELFKNSKLKGSKKYKIELILNAIIGKADNPIKQVFIKNKNNNQ